MSSFDFVNTWIPIPIVQIILIGEYGIITFGLTYAIAIVFPVVTAFFIMFAILEDSGYLPRLAFLADRLFRSVGLNGKAVLPLILGTACGTMATMTTRILDTRKELMATGGDLREILGMEGFDLLAKVVLVDCLLNKVLELMGPGRIETFSALIIIEQILELFHLLVGIGG